MAVASLKKHRMRVFSNLKYNGIFPLCTGETLFVRMGEVFYLLENALAMQQQMAEYRRILHGFAEVGFELPKTYAYVESVLRELGYMPKKTGRCGLTATIGNGRPVLLLRADMDALPIPEQSDLPFASTNGNAHLCGHDLHTAMLLGAASLLKQHEKSLHGTVELMFQPAEELLAGATDMLADGLLKDPLPDAALMLHTAVMKDVPVGTLIVPTAGISAPAADMFEITVAGKGCHGAMPQNGIDPINAGAHLVLSLQTISTREVSLSDAHALTIAAFNAGEAANAMANSAVLRGSVRSYSPELQLFLKERIVQIAENTANTFRASAQVHWLRGCPPLKIDPALTAFAKTYLPNVAGRDRVLVAEELQEADVRSVGSEDFAYISQQIPSLMLAICAGNGEYGLHHPGVIFDEAALPYGAAAYAGFALEREEQ